MIRIEAEEICINTAWNITRPVVSIIVLFRVALVLYCWSSSVRSDAIRYFLQKISILLCSSIIFRIFAPDFEIVNLNDRLHWAEFNLIIDIFLQRFQEDGLSPKSAAKVEVILSPARDKCRLFCRLCRIVVECVESLSNVSNRHKKKRPRRSLKSKKEQAILWIPR